MSHQPVWKTLGFASDPFAYFDAEREPLLDVYFVPPPYFDSVIGDSDHIASCVVFAPRGGGKTAQRRIVVHELTRQNYVCAHYISFRLPGDSLSDLSATGKTFHTANIVAAIVKVIEQDHLIDAIDGLDDQDKYRYELLQLTPGYGSTDSLDLSVVAKSPAFAKYRGMFGHHASLDDVLQTLEREIKGRKRTPIEDLDFVVSLCMRAGKSGVAVVVDKLDETALTTTPDTAAILARALLCEQELLERSNFALKIFAWNKLRPFFYKHGRPDRTRHYDCTWQPANLVTALQARLKAHSTGTISSFGQIVEEFPDHSELDNCLAILADRSPRNLIRLCHRIVAEHGSLDTAATSISLPLLERGILSYCKEVLDEDDLQLRDITVLANLRVTFSASDVETALGGSSRDARKFTQRMVDKRILDELPDVNTIQSTAARSEVYTIRHPAAFRLAASEASTIALFRAYWRRCHACGSGRFINQTRINGRVHCSCGASLAS